MLGHGAYTQMSFCPRSPKLGLSRLWRPITFYVDIQLRWCLMKSCSLRWDLSNVMWHASKSRRFSTSFGHNLCFKYPNGSCEHILDICILRDFQWYKELFNPMIFYLCNCALHIQKSIEIPTPKVGAHLGVWGFILSFFYSHGSIKCDSWASILADTFASPCFCHKPKVKVATIFLLTLCLF